MEQPASKLVNRRSFIKRTTATAGALAASAYVKPDMRSLGIPTAFAAVSSPTTTTTEFDTGTPGYWANSGNMDAGGKNLWDMTTDEEWTAAGGLGTNPYIHSTVFNTFFQRWDPFGDLTMYDVANQSGDGSNKALQAARSLIAAYLNSSFYGSVPDGYPKGFPLSISQLEEMWAEAVASGKRADFVALNCTLDNANNGLALDASCE